MITISAIQNATAHAFRISPEKMREPLNRGLGKDGRNARPYSHPRQVAMYLAADLTDHSLKRIGYYFGRRDHSTVIFAINEVEKRLQKDSNLCRKVNEIVHVVKAKCLGTNENAANSRDLESVGA